MRLGNIFESIPDDLDEEFFDQIVQNQRVRIERIVSRGQVSPESGWYDQDQDEWVLLLKGGAVIAFADGTEARLESGDHINLPAHTRHRVSWSAPETETIWLAVHY